MTSGYDDFDRAQEQRDRDVPDEPYPDRFHDDELDERAEDEANAIRLEVIDPFDRVIGQLHVPRQP